MPQNIDFATLCSSSYDGIPNEVFSHQLPVYLTSTFEFDSFEQAVDVFARKEGTEKTYFYSRYGNPTTAAVAERIANLEGFGTMLDLRGILTGSGMAAIATLLMGRVVKADRILTQTDLYGGTTELMLKVLQPLGIEPIFTDLADLDAVKHLLETTQGIKLLYAETPANPTLRCYDLEALSRLAHEYGVEVAVDNTFATPYLQQPMMLGVDYVIHSTTKYLNGHGTATGGVIVGKAGEAMQRVWQAMKLLGTNGNPLEAWILMNGMRTLALRMDRHSENALALATFLTKHPAVTSVNYPFLASHPTHAVATAQMRKGGGMLSFNLAGGYDAARHFINTIQLCINAPSLGDADTLVLHPASSSHLNVPKAQREASGIGDGLVRISVGIEHIDDIIADVALGLE